MTLIFTSIAPRLIVVSADSVVTNTFDDHFEYQTAPKAYEIPGIGCVATWGERVGNNIGSYLRNPANQAKIHSIFDLRDLAWNYLTQKYNPREENLDRVGYHVTGFDTSGQPHHYQILWAPKSREVVTEVSWEYQNLDCSPGPKALQFDYDGRFSLAHTEVQTLVNEINTGRTVRYDITSTLGLIQFNDFVIRFASEITPEVGPPFYHYLIAPDNRIARIKNDSGSPMTYKNILLGLSNLKEL